MSEPSYRILERIDSGGMAEVFKANATSVRGYQKLVAIKRVLPSLTKNERFVRMFLDEAKLSLHLSHTNIVQVFDLGRAGGTYFIVMEYVEGTDLRKVLSTLQQTGQRLRVEEAVYIALEITKGLAHAHGKKDSEGRDLEIVHRDVSPPNVLLSQEGEVKLTDFGLAKARTHVDDTEPGVVKGKFGYLSPEAAKGKEVDHRSDLFCVGIVLWEMLATRRLFNGEDNAETVKMIKRCEVPFLSEVGRQIPSRLEQIIRTALEEDRDERYQSARQLGRDLGDFMYAYGEAITDFRLSTRIEELGVFAEEREAAEPMDDTAGELLEDELNELVSFEEIGDLDRFLAERYETQTNNTGESQVTEADAEDPRHWWGKATITKEMPQIDDEQVQELRDTWKEGQLSSLLAQGQIYSLDKQREKLKSGESTDPEAEVNPAKQPERAKKADESEPEEHESGGPVFSRTQLVVIGVVAVTVIVGSLLFFWFFFGPF